MFPQANLSSNVWTKHILIVWKQWSWYLFVRVSDKRLVDRCVRKHFFLLQQHKCNGRLSSETRFILIQLHKFIGHVTSETCFLKLNYTSLMDSRIRKHVSFWFNYISVIDSCVRGMVLNMCYNTCTIVSLLYVSSVMSWWLACEWTEIAFVHYSICVSQRLRFKQINVSVMRAVCCRCVNDVLF